MSSGHIFFPNKSLNRTTYNSSGSFTVPAGIFNVVIYGCGGGTGSDDDDVIGGGGAPLGVVLRDVTPGNVLTVTVGAGGVGDAAGGSSFFGSIEFKGANKTVYISGSTAGGERGGVATIDQIGESNVSFSGGGAGNAGGGGGAGPFGDGAESHTSAANNTGAGGGAGDSGPITSGGSGKVIVTW